MAQRNMLLGILLLCCSSLTASAQSYLPVGPKTNIPVATVVGSGWAECYRDTYDVPLNADTVLAACAGANLMLACRPTGSNILTLLAQAPRTDVTFDTGDNDDQLHTANGVGWYFNSTGRDSWGFVLAGDPVEKDNCDIDASPDASDRLCWHLSGIGGYRCGSTTGLNNSDTFERIVYSGSGIAQTAPAISSPALCLLGLVLLAIGGWRIRHKEVG